MRDMMAKLKLTVNETKTRLCRVPDESFDFLGYTIGRCYSPRTGGAYIGMRPSAKKIHGVCAGRSASRPSGGGCGWTPTELVGRLNRMLRGWANYFCLGTVTAAYRSGGQPTPAIGSVSGWCGSTRCRGRSGSRYSEPYLHATLGLVRLARPTSSALVGERMKSLSESRMREIRTSGSMSGKWKRSMVGYSGTGNRKGRQQQGHT